MGKEATEPRLVVANLTSGRNGADPPLSLKETECVDAFNVDWWNATLARKRNGAVRLLTPSPPSPVTPFVGHVSFLGRHIPGTDETAAMLFGVDDAFPNPAIGSTIVPGSQLFYSVSAVDPITGNGWDVQGQSLKNKYFMAYKSGVPRLHVYDPTLPGGIAQFIRRAGLAAPVSGLTGANTGVGTYPAVPRWYRARVITQVGGVTTRRSEPGPTGLASPSGTGIGVLITFPASPIEGETHWELEASLDNASYFVLQTVAVGTVSVVDSVLTTDYVNYPLSPATGTYGLQKSYRFIGVDGNRIVGFGSFTDTDPQNRFEFSAPGGSTNISDEERVPLGNYIDLDEADSGAPTGLCGPVFGAFYLFKYRQVWKVVRTGIGSQPYVVFPVSKVVGAINQQCIEIGEDAAGNPAVYFISVRGAYRLTIRGLEYIGKPNEDLWYGPTSFINLAATKVVAHAVYHGDRRQMWFWVAFNAGNDPDVRLVYDVRHSAWSRHGGASCRARCSAMHSALTTVSIMKPYCGNTDGIANVFRCDDDNALDDNGEPFYAFVQTKPYALGGLGAYCTVGQGTLTALAANGVTITLTLTRDLGKETQTSSCVLTPQGSETRVQKLFDAATMAGAWAVSFQIGDATPVAKRWQLDALTINYVKDEALV